MNNIDLKNRVENVLNEQVVLFNPNGKIQTVSGDRFYLKSGLQSNRFICELNGLNSLRTTQSINICQGIAAEHDYILTEYIEPVNPKTDFYSNFGTSLAQMHQFKSERYGFWENNFIGANPQINTPSDEESTDWVAFFYNKRLLYQYKMAESNSRVSKEMKRSFLRLESQVEELLRPYVEPPTLIHGDLWAGNYICSPNNEVVLIDPAVYYGQREAELALAKLFGGFHCSFFESYHNEYPLQEGWEEREGIYRLYHVLNHLNIFGSGYLSEAEFLIRKYSLGVN